MRNSLAKDALRDVRKRIGKQIHKVSVKELTIGISYTGVRISSDDVGIANTPLNDFSPHNCNIFSRAGSLADMPAEELAELAQSWDLSERVVGITTLNALSQLAIKVSGGDIARKYGDAVDLTKVRKKDTVVMVGNMRPSVEKLRRAAREVLVLERTVDLRDKDTFPDTAAEVIIPRGDVVFFTGATLCNGTADRILELSKNAREVVMLGASAGIFPPTMFEKGATAVAPMEVFNPGKAMRAISEGGGTFALLKSARFVVYTPKIQKKRS